MIRPVRNYIFATSLFQKATVRSGALLAGTLLAGTLLAGTLFAGTALLGATPAAAADTGSAAGSQGQRLTVSRHLDLDPAGEIVTVTGTGYDQAKGIYLAFCVLPASGTLPTPCGGGADLSGETGSSVWISSNPPSYGKSLAVPYSTGGSFNVQLHVAAALNDTTDCRALTCAVVTRADHTRTEDRSQDVAVPVTFAGKAHSANRLPVIAAGGAALLIAASAAALLIRRRIRKHVPGDG